MKLHISARSIALSGVALLIAGSAAIAVVRARTEVDLPDAKRAVVIGPDLLQLIVDALDLDHGVGYGRTYYSRQRRAELREVLVSAMSAGAVNGSNEVITSPLTQCSSSK